MMRGALVLVVLFVVFSSSSFGATVKFLTSIPVNYSQTATSIAAGLQLAFNIWNTAPKQSYAQTQFNLSLDVVFNNYSLVQLQSDVGGIIDDETYLGVAFAATDAAALTVRDIVNGTDLLFINPTSSHGNISNPFIPNIINFRPSYSQDIYSLIAYITSFKQIQRIALVHNSTRSVLYYDTVQKTLYSRGLSTVAELDYGTPRPMSESVNIIAAGNPQAVLLLIQPDEFLTLVPPLSAALPASTWYIVPRSQALSNLLPGALPRFLNIYLPGTFPSRLYLSDYYPNRADPNNPMNLKFNDDFRKFNDSKVFQAGSFGYEGYLTGRWITSVISKINKYPFTRSDFLEAAYDSPVLTMNQWTLGPINNDPNEGIYDVCNQLTHGINVAGYDPYPGSRLGYWSNITVAGAVSWLTCEPQIPNLSPVPIGFVYHSNDTNAILLEKGVELALQVLTEKATFNKRPVQIIKQVIPNNMSAVDVSLQLIKEFKVVAFVGMSEDISLQILDYLDQTGAKFPMIVDPMTPLKAVREPFNMNFMNIRIGIQDAVISAFYFLTSQNQSDVNVAIYYENDTQGMEFIQNVYKVMDIFNSFYNEGTIPSIGNVKGRARVKIVVSMSSDNIGTIPIQNTVDQLERDRTPIDWLILFTREPMPTVLDVVEMLNEVQPKLVNSNGMPHMNVLGLAAYRHTNISRLLRNTTMNEYYSANLNPVVGTVEGFFTTNVTLRDSYYSGAYARGQIPNEVGLAGYLTGMIVGQVVNDLHGNVNETSFMESVYNFATNIFYIDGLTTGPFKYNIASNSSNSSSESTVNQLRSATITNVTGCNQGAQSSIFYTQQNGQLIPKWYYYWSGSNSQNDTCGAQFPQVNSNIHNNQRSVNLAAIIVPVICGFFAIICCAIIVAAAIIAYTIYTNPINTRRRHLKEPDYTEFAVKRKFREPNEDIDTIFLTALLHLEAPQRMERIGMMESFILEPEYIYPIMQALTKAGVARDEVAACVVCIYSADDQIESLFKYAIRREIKQAQDASVLFREDSILAALWGAYCKLVGLPYLWRVLAETIYDIGRVSGDQAEDDYAEDIEMTIFQKAGSYEVDKKRIDTSGGGSTISDDRFVNLLHLKLAAQSTFNKIRAVPFPPELSFILSTIRSRLSGEYQDLTQGVLSNFIFLRFMCLAITTPNQFGLWKTTPEAKTLRFLVIMSKVIQNLGFGVEFDKEESMTDLNDFITQNKEGMVEWLNSVSQDDVDDAEEEDEDKEQGGRRESGMQKIEVTEEVKIRCLKWILGQIYCNRQVIRRDMTKKLGTEQWRQIRSELESIGVLKRDHGTGSQTDHTGGVMTSVAKSGNTRSDREDFF
eukprot:TRINITY_DN5793_c0_g1_i2.p1 TRINITY_DN5793_c0_g1~~TRINITY_DN5793_c0_g1_i2.p1  ORF type:complete len:1342 (-),score=161.20 TRINITY_DN5793_c0_g1_i2:71-4096(-)